MSSGPENASGNSAVTYAAWKFTDPRWNVIKFCQPDLEPRLVLHLKSQPEDHPGLPESFWDFPVMILGIIKWKIDGGILSIII